MKINFAIWSAGLEGGGGVRLVFEIANWLSKMGDKVSITALGGDHRWFPLEAEVNYVGLPKTMRFVSPLFRLGHKRPMTFLDVRFTRLGSRPHLDLTEALSEATPDCDANVATWFHTAFAVWLSKKGQRFYLMQDFYEQMKNDYDQKLFRDTLKLPMYFLTISKYTQQIVLEIQPNARSKIIGAGVNTEVFYPRKKKTIASDGHPVIMVMARKEPFKRTALAIESINEINKITPIHAVLVGEIPQNVKMNFPYSCFKHVSDDELANLYSNSDVFLFTSVAEGFALPPLEAMACGTPVVTTNCKGNLDYATDGFNCLISPPEDKEQLVSLTVNVLRKEKLRDRLIAGGLETAKRFTWSSVVDRFEKALKENA